VASGRLVPASGQIPVHTAPFWLRDGISFPCVSVHLTSSAQETWFVGEVAAPPIDNGDGTVTEFEGVVRRTQIDVVAVSQNGDERLELRKAVERVILANIPVFEGLGFSDVTISQADSEDFESKNVPLFMSQTTLTGLSVSFVGKTLPALRSVNSCNTD
jgi:hypothetical protein